MKAGVNIIRLSAIFNLEHAYPTCTSLSFLSHNHLDIDIYQFYLYLQILTIVVIIYLLVQTIRAKTSKAVISLMLVNVSSLFYMVGYLLEHTTQDLSVICAAIKVEYCGSFGMFMFMYWFYDIFYHRAFNKWIYALGCLIGTITIISVFTFENHTYFYASYRLLNFDTYSIIQSKPGIFYVLYYLLNILILSHQEYFSVISLLKYKSSDRMQGLLILIAPLFPLISIFIKWIGLSNGHDSMAIGVLGFLTCLTIAVVRYDYFGSLRNENETDPLTGVSNREYFKKRVQSILTKHLSGGFVMIDIDNFKMVNDTYGHVTGDEVLVCFSDTLRSIVSDEYLITRIGGDEFCFYLAGVTQEEKLEKVAKRLLTHLEENQEHKKLPCRCSCSIGISIYDGTYDETFEKLYENADKALYLAKNSGKCQCRFYK